MLIEIASVLIVLASTALLTGCVRWMAIARGTLDVPNARSSHTRPTARGGGLAIVVVLMGSVFALQGYELISTRALIACALGGVLVAAVGYVDDVKGLPARSRFLVHIVAATVAAACFVFEADTTITWWTAVLSLSVVVGIAWSINLFNFMDGIDGIAATEAVFVSASSGWLMSTQDPTSIWWLIEALTAASCLGFLIWNWPPARIFMGDVGSGFLGFWLAALAVGAHFSATLPICTSLILGSIFAADATTTLVMRIVRGDRWHEAHRTHAYQILSRRWGSHLPVTAMVAVLNLVIVLPLAYLSLRSPQIAIWIAIAVITGFSMLAVLVGAGRSSR